MPFIHIRSRPEDQPADVAAALARVLDAAAGATGVERRHFTATWQTAEVVGAEGEPPLLVDVLIPDLHPAPRVEALLRSIAETLGSVAGVGPERVFVNASHARSGMVFDGGEIVRW